jgi:hypothetical protein
LARFFNSYPINPNAAISLGMSRLFVENGEAVAAIG